MITGVGERKGKRGETKQKKLKSPYPEASLSPKYLVWVNRVVACNVTILSKKGNPAEAFFLSGAVLFTTKLYVANCC